MDANTFPLSNFKDVENMIKYLVSRATKHLKVAYLDPQDLINEGMLAAYAAIDTYDPTAGASIMTWVFWKARGRINNKLRNEIRRVRLSRDISKYETQLSETPDTQEAEDQEFIELREKTLNKLQPVLSPKAYQLLHLNLTSYPTKLTLQVQATLLGVSLKDLNKLYQEINNSSAVLGVLPRACA